MCAVTCTACFHALHGGGLLVSFPSCRVPVLSSPVIPSDLLHRDVEVNRPPLGLHD